MGAADAVQDAISHGDKWKASDDAVHLIGEITPLLGPVLLLFGPASEAAREAKDAITELWRAGAALASSRFPEASAAFRQAKVCHANFQRAVLRTLGHEPP